MQAHKTTVDARVEDEMDSSLFEGCSSDELAGYLLGGKNRMVVVSSSVGQTAVWRSLDGFGTDEWWLQDLPIDDPHEAVPFRGSCKDAIEEAIQMAGFVEAR